MQKKLVMLFIAILLAFVILVGRITYINASSGEDYTKTVLDQQQYMSRSIPFKRGDIVDTNGTKLATSERVYNVILDAKVLLSDETKKAENIAATKKALKSYFQIKASAVDAIIADSPDSRYNILKKGISYDDAKAFEAAEKKNSKIKGVWLEEDYVRKYPYNTLACDVLGFSVSGNVGASGLEASYNSTLNGTDGRRYGYQNEDSAIENTVKEPINGNTIVTTIDANLQSIVEKHLEEFNQAHTDEAQEGMGFKNGAVIMMNPNTGEVLAMASSPTYDLNNPRDLSKYYTEEEITGMSSDDKIDALNELWRNFCVSDTFEPGSTIKPFTVATGLEIGALKGDETYYCGGSLQIDEWEIKCISYDNGGHGQQNLTQVMENSCNVALMQIGLAIGPEEFCKYQSIFGFGQYTGIDLPGEAVGILQSPDGMIKTDLATNSFGQNFNVTMLRLATGFCSLINGGDYYEPHLVKAIQDENGNVINGDMIIYIYGCYLKERGKLAGNKVVTTVMSNFGLYKALDDAGIEYEKTAVGDKYVYENMSANGYRVGGEQSGHIIFRKYATTGDGILTAIKMMEVMLEKKKTLAELAAPVPVYPQVLKNIRVTDKAAAQNDPDVQAAVKAVGEKLGSDGRILVRESGTEPLVRVMVEAGEEALCEKYVDEVIDVIVKNGYRED